MLKIDDCSLPCVSVVVIGRNEAENLPACIGSIRAMNYPHDRLEIIYVDTDSSDGSPDVARSLGVIVYEEHSNFPSPGRARNRGWREANYGIVHFVDGDMTVEAQYLRQAVQCLELTGVVCVIGRLKERHADHNLIARILEYPWKVKEVGEIDAPGGGGTFVRSALDDVNGYDPEILKGQETELGCRLRQRGTRILLIDVVMGIHDYEIRSLMDLWVYYEKRGQSFAHLLGLPESPSIEEAQRAARRMHFQIPMVALSFILLCMAGLWWILLVIPLALISYITVRYWQPPKLRHLRISYFLLDYFFKPVVWWGMIRVYLDRWKH